MGVPFVDLKLAEIENNVVTGKIGDVEIEVKQYLPIAEKLELVGRIIMNALDDNAIPNTLKIGFFTDIEIILAYSNIEFSEDEMNNHLSEVYDILEQNGIIEQIISKIPESEYETILDAIEETIQSFYKYKSSLRGMIDNVMTDYKDTEVDVEALKEKIDSGEGMELIKEVVEKLG